MTNLDLLKQYASLKTTLKQIESQLEMMKPQVLEATADFILENHGKLPEVDNGVFCISKRKIWKYTDWVRDAERELEDRMKEEEARGIAEVKLVDIVIFKSKNDG